MKNKIGRQVLKSITFLCLLVLLAASFAGAARATAPPVPTGVSANPGSAQAVISWSASTGATSYLLYRGTSSGGESTTAIATITAPNVAYTNTGLTNGTKYYYKLKASSSGGTSAYSSEVSLTPFAAPTSLVATAGNGKMALTFTAGAGDASYDIFRGVSPGGESTTALGTSTSASYTDSTALNGTLYYYTVKAFSGAVLSAATNEVSGTPRLTPPTSPAATASGLTITTTWTAVSNATGYNVYRGVSAGGESTTSINSSPVSALTYTDSSGLAAATKYYYKLKSVSATDTSPTYSTEVSATTAPAAPASPAATALTTTSIKVTWTSSATATSYIILQSSTGSAPWTQVGTSTTTSFTNTGLSASFTYYYEVEASSAAGPSPPSAIVHATLKPNPPSGVTAAPGTGQIAIAWSAEGACTYTLSRGNATGGPYTAIVTNTSSTSYTDTGLNARAYYYVVTAANSAGTSTNSTEVSAIPTAASGAVAYQIQMAATGSSTAPYVTNPLNLGLMNESTTTLVTVNNVVDPAPESVYQVSPLCNLPGLPTVFSFGGLQPSTNYTVRLHFAEIGEDTLSDTDEVPLGMRVFDATLNGTQVLTKFDILAAAGSAYKAVVEQFNITSTSSGVMGLTLTSDAGTQLNDGPTINGLEILTGSCVPSAPYGLTATQQNTQVNLSWKAQVGAVSYNIYRSDLSGGETLDQSGITTNTFTDTIPDTTQTYYYVVTAVNSVGEGQQSLEANTIPLCSAPPAPTGFIATISSATNEAILQWNGVNGAAYYRVYSSYSLLGPYGVLATQQSYGSAVYDIASTNVLGYGTFYYVTSVSGCGTESPPSEIQVLEYAESYQLPQGGSGVIPTSGANCPNLGTWEVTDIAGNLLADSLTPGNWVVSDDTSGNISLTVPVSAPITQYNRVSIERPSSSICDSANFDIVNFPAPTLSATAADSAVNLIWTSISGATGYNIYRNTNNGFSFFFVNSATSTSYTDSGLNNGTTYYYVVTATNAYSSSPPSNTASADPDGPIVVPTLSASSTSSGVDLSWTAAEGTPAYNLYRGTSRGGEVITAPYASAISGTTYFDSGVLPGTEYYYLLTAVIGGTEYDPSNEVFGGIIGFSVTATPTSITVARGATAALPVVVSSSGGFEGQVTLSTTGLPANTAYWSYPGSLALYPPQEYVIAQSPVYAANVCTSNLYITPALSAAPGTYSVSITGTSGAYSNSQVITVIID